MLRERVSDLGHRLKMRSRGAPQEEPPRPNRQERRALARLRRKAKARRARRIHEGRVPRKKKC